MEEGRVMVMMKYRLKDEKYNDDNLKCWRMIVKEGKERN